jgi:hypothetical protein
MWRPSGPFYHEPLDRNQALGDVFERLARQQSMGHYEDVPGSIPQIAWRWDAMLKRPTARRLLTLCMAPLLVPSSRSDANAESLLELRSQLLPHRLWRTPPRIIDHAERDTLRLGICAVVRIDIDQPCSDAIIA